jgi:uncharacterized protein involved in outer membrane biogenesis
MSKRIVFAGAAALAGVLVLTLLSVNLLVERNKDFLIGRAEQAFGRKISVEQIEVSFWPFGARLLNFAMADDPAFSAKDFVRTKELRLELRLLPLFIGEFHPRRITLDSPLITVVRDASGRYNFASRDRSEKTAREGADRGFKRPTEPAINQFLLLPAFDIADGTLRYRDLTDGGELVISRIDLKASDFEPDQPFEIELEASVNASKPNLRFKSVIGPVAGNRDFRDVPLAGEINANDLDLGKVNKALPQLRKALPPVLRFDGIYTIKELKFKGTLNNLSLKGAVTGTDASFRFE